MSPDGNYLYVADRDNDKLRKINIRTQSTVTLKIIPDLSKPSFISLTSDGFYALVCETSTPSIKQISIETGVVTELAGGNPAQGAMLGAVGSILQSPSGIALLQQVPSTPSKFQGLTSTIFTACNLVFKTGIVSSTN